MCNGAPLEGATGAAPLPGVELCVCKCAGGMLPEEFDPVNDELNGEEVEPPVGGLCELGGMCPLVNPRYVEFGEV